MKPSRLTIFVMILVIGFFLVACGDQKPTKEKQAISTQDVKKKDKELADTALAFSIEQKEKYTEQVLDRLAQYNLKFMELDRKVSMLSGQARNDMMGEIANVNTKKSQVAAKMRELNSSTGEAWKDLTVGLDKAVDDLDEAYKQATSRY